LPAIRIAIIDNHGQATPQTLLDYLVIAISPAMIIVLVDSLALFLVEVFYRARMRDGWSTSSRSS